MSDIVIVGAGGHGRELWWIAQSTALAASVTGVVDDAELTDIARERLDAIGAPFLGSPAQLDGPRRFIAALGASNVRRTVAERLHTEGWSGVELVHPDAIIGPEVSRSTGLVVFPRCLVTTNVRFGVHVHLNAGTVVQHDTSIGDFVTLSPGVYVNGDVTIGDDVFVGTGARITRGVTVGDGARIGAGAVVLDDVAPGALVVGAPAQPPR